MSPPHILHLIIMLVFLPSVPCFFEESHYIWIDIRSWKSFMRLAFSGTFFPCLRMPPVYLTHTRFALHGSVRQNPKKPFSLVCPLCFVRCILFCDPSGQARFMCFSEKRHSHFSSFEIDFLCRSNSNAFRIFSASA